MAIIDFTQEENETLQNCTGSEMMEIVGRYVDTSKGFMLAGNPQRIYTDADIDTYEIQPGECTFTALSQEMMDARNP